MGFLFKCLFCIALVYVAVQWRSNAPVGARAPEARVASRPAPQKRPQTDAPAQTLLRAGADSLTASAREWCVSAPKDCVAVLQRAQSGLGKDR